MIIEIIKTIFLGIVEGITEWLPISSTGHMILFDEFITLNVSDSFKEMFFVVIQLGAILAVVVLYFDKLNPFSRRKNIIKRERTFSLWLKIIAACIPAGVMGFLFDDFLDEHFYNFITVAVMLILYGIIFIIVEKINKNRRASVDNIDNLSFARAFMIGIFQVLALIPGTSRSGATIIGGLIIGVSREAAAEFTFFLAIPVMLGASVLKTVKMLLETGMLMSGYEFLILITGVLTAFIVSILAIRFLMRYIKRNDFSIFGYYRIILGVVLVIYFLAAG